MSNKEDLTTTERVGKIVWSIAGGEQLTTMEIADAVGIGYRGAHKMMGRLARVLPIAYDQSGRRGVWYRMEGQR